MERRIERLEFPTAMFAVELHLLRPNDPIMKKGATDDQVETEETNREDKDSRNALGKKMKRGTSKRLNEVESKSILSIPLRTEDIEEENGQQA